MTGALGGDVSSLRDFVGGFAVPGLVSFEGRCLVALRLRVGLRGAELAGAGVVGVGVAHVVAEDGAAGVFEETIPVPRG